jgi:hypothetical protein
MHSTLARIAAFLGVKVITNASGTPVSESTLTPDLQRLIEAREAYEDELREHQGKVYSYTGDPSDQYIVNTREKMNYTAESLANTNSAIRALLEDQGFTERETADPDYPVDDYFIEHPNGTSTRVEEYADGSKMEYVYGTDEMLITTFKIHPDGTREEI